MGRGKSSRLKPLLQTFGSLAASGEIFLFHLPPESGTASTLLNACHARLAASSSAHPLMNQPQRFTRSINDRVLAGVVGGIAHRYGWNSTLLRAIYVIASVLSAAFPGILVYLILWLLMPEGND